MLLFIFIVLWLIKPNKCIFKACFSYLLKYAKKVPEYVLGLCIINVYYIFISVIVCSVSMILRLTVFLTLKQKWQVFKANMMSILLHLVTKHGIYNLISHKRRAVIIPACQKGAQTMWCWAPTPVFLSFHSVTLFNPVQSCSWYERNK